MSFAHLHVHSTYSLREGACRPAELAARAAELGYEHVACTDTDGLYGAVRFAKACRDSGVHPVFGAEVHLDPERWIPSLGLPGDGIATRRTRGSVGPSAGADFTAGYRAGGYSPPGPASGSVAGGFSRAGSLVGRSSRIASTPGPGAGPAYLEPGQWATDPADPLAGLNWRRLPSVLLLARDATGLANLCRLLTAAHHAGERGDPRVTPEMLAAHGGGLYCLLGPDSPPGRLAVARRFDQAGAVARRFAECLDQNACFVEVTHHLARGDNVRAARLLRLAEEAGLAAVATNSVRYLVSEDAILADVLESMRRVVPMNPRNSGRANSEAYLKSADEMARVPLFAERPELLAKAGELAERCEVDLGLGEVHFPAARLPEGMSPMRALVWRCRQGITTRGMRGSHELGERLSNELAVISKLGFAPYFLVVAGIVERIRAEGIRCACRGSGAGSLVNYLLGISGVDPIEHGLVFERFCSLLRPELPDIDLDVESARREEVYRDILSSHGEDRAACVCMVDTYRARHAIRDVGKALGLPEVEVDFVAKAFPHIRAGAVRQAMAELPELRGSNLDAGQLETLFSLVERLDGFPRHLALHPSGIILSDYDLPDRVPLERSLRGFSMAQYDKDDVEDLGLMKLDVLGVRMQSAIAHALAEVRRVKGVDLDIDAVPRDDEETFRLIRSSRTLGCFQIESPGQRELLGKLQPTWFGDLIVDISLFRPGPVKSDMVRPFLEGRLGFRPPVYAHPRLREVLGETFGVIVYHEQVMRVARAIAGYNLAEADLLRRRLSNDPAVCARLREEFLARAESGGVSSSQAGPIFDDLAAFASFGFCKAHAAAFALPTYQSAYLKVHETAAFLAGVLTHDPGMYPRRLILEDGRQFGVPILPLDVNRSAREYTIEEVNAGTECLYRPPGNQALTAKAARGPRGRGDGPPASADLETRSGIEGMDGLPAAIAGAPVADPRYGIRLGLQDVKGISDAEIEEILTKRPFVNLADFCARAAVSRPVAENLVEAGALRDVERGVSRRDLFLLVSERWQARGSSRSAGGRSASRRPANSGNRATDGAVTDPLPFPEFQDPLPGLRDYSAEETVQAELEVLGLDASCHLLDFYRPLLEVLRVVPAVRLRDRNRSGARVRVAGVKVASQTPPVKSGQRVIFITLDDSTGCADVTFFSSAQERCARTIFHSWLLLAEGNLRKTGARGVSINGEMAWDLRHLWRAWKEGRLDEALIEGTEGEVAREPAIAGSYGEEAMSGRGRTPTRRLWQASAGSAG